MQLNFCAISGSDFCSHVIQVLLSLGISISAYFLVLMTFLLVFVYFLMSSIFYFFTALASEALVEDVGWSKGAVHIFVINVTSERLQFSEIVEEKLG